jgi:hypothetical protein
VSPTEIPQFNSEVNLCLFDAVKPIRT